MSNTKTPRTRSHDVGPIESYGGNTSESAIALDSDSGVEEVSEVQPPEELDEKPKEKSKKKHKEKHREKHKKHKDHKDHKETKETKEIKDHKETKETKETKDTKHHKNHKDHKEKHTKVKPDSSAKPTEEPPVEESDSSDEIAIVLVENLPDEKKFLRKRKAKLPDAEKKQKLPDDPESDHKAELGDSDSASDSDLFVDATLTSHNSEDDFSLPQAVLPEVIEVDSEAEEAPVAPQSVTSSKSARSSIRLLYNPSYGLGETAPDQEVNLDTVTVEELVGTKDLVQTYQFNFNVDLEYFLSFFHPDFLKSRGKITFITGSSILAAHPLRDFFKDKFDISEVVALLPNRFASHHSKMMVNFFDNDEVEIVIMTCNLTQLDFGGLTQAVWRSGRLSKGKTSTTLGKRFRLDLIRYLARYKLRATDVLLKKLEHLDFSSVDVELVASVPGTYSLDDLKPAGEAYGYAKLRQVLERNRLLLSEEKDHHNVLAQVTSIAYPYVSRKGQTSSIFTHLLCPLLFSNWKRQLEPGAKSSQTHQKDFNYNPCIVFPTSKEIASSNFGFLSGSAVHFKYTTSAIHKQQFDQNIKPYLYKWSGDLQTGREKVTPHVKYYACDNGDNWKTLKWVLVGSHNLSKQAWGFPVAKSLGSSYQVDSYELSVFKPGGDQPLIPVYGSDVLPKGEKGIPVRFPFSVPPEKYGLSDQPWSAEVDFGKLKDRWGNTFKGSFL